MSDQDVTIKDGANTDRKIDTRAVGAGTDEHRQVVVIGDPTAAARVALVDANGGLVTSPLMLNGNPLQPAVDDALSGSDTLSVGPLVYNGTTWDRLRGNTAGLFAQGNVAHDGVDAGNPVKIGGKAVNGVPTAVSAGDRADAWFGMRGQQAVSIVDIDSGSAVLFSQPVNADDAGMASGLGVASAGLLWNGVNESWDRLRGNTAGLFAQGNVAHDDVDSGNPVKIGGVASGGPTAVAAGDRVNAWFQTRGQLAVMIADSGGSTTNFAAPGIGDGASVGNMLPVSSVLRLFNGTTWDRLRGDTAGLFAQGNVAHDGVDSGNPVKIGGKATSGTPSNASATNDRVDAAFDLSGRLAVSLFPSGAGQNGVDGSAQIVVAKHGSTTTDAIGTAGYVFNGTSWDRVRSIGGLPAADANTGIQAVAQVPHKIGYTIASATAQYTSTQTSTTLGPTVSASQRMVVTSIQIQAGGTTAGSVQIYFGTGAYSRGTTPAVFDGSFTPSATNHPGYAQSPSVPYMGAADAELRVTTSAAVNPLTVTVWYYLVAV